MEQQGQQEGFFGKFFSFFAWRWWVGIGLLTVIVIVVVWFAVVMVAPSPDKNKYQAVFLTNGQVYFGHLEKAGGGYVRLSDIYYLQVQGPDLQQQSQSTSPNINLIKLGEELHGPEDAMFIPNDRILFWENLRDDSRVVQVIKQGR